MVGVGQVLDEVAAILVQCAERKGAAGRRAEGVRDMEFVFFKCLLRPAEFAKSKQKMRGGRLKPLVKP